MIQMSWICEVSLTTMEISIIYLSLSLSHFKNFIVCAVYSPVHLLVRSLWKSVYTSYLHNCPHYFLGFLQILGCLKHLRAVIWHGRTNQLKANYKCNKIAHSEEVDLHRKSTSTYTAAIQPARGFIWQSLEFSSKRFVKLNKCLITFLRSVTTWDNQIHRSTILMMSNRYLNHDKSFINTGRFWCVRGLC